MARGPEGRTDGLPGAFATATPASLCRLVGAIAEGTVVDREASGLMFDTLAHQHFQTGMARSFLGLTEPGSVPEMWPAIANKTGEVPGVQGRGRGHHFPGRDEDRLCRHGR